MFLLGSLLAFPTPGVFTFTPLEAATGFGPLTVQAHMQAIVFGPGRESARPNVIATSLVESDAVMQHSHRARHVREILARNECVIVGAASVRKALKERAAARGFEMHRKILVSSFLE